MVADFVVAPGNMNSLELGPNDLFVYGLPWGIDAAWSERAVLRIASEDGSRTHDFHKDQGETHGDFVVFTFTESLPDVRYTAKVLDGEVEFDLFGAVELWRVQDAHDACNWVPLPDPHAD